MTGSRTGGDDSAGATANSRRGRRLGVDVGSVRIGLAASDPDGLLASPLETVPRGEGDLRRIVAIAVDQQAVEVVVGLPLSLSGRAGSAAATARDFAAELAAALTGAGLEVSVRLVDERLTTVSAERVLREQGRSARQQRMIVDQAAAVVILQHALDAERATGRPPGEEVRRHR